MAHLIRKIVIVGGGAAGWLTAGVIAAGHRTHAGDGLRIVVVESPDVATIGVGEGTWPSMRDTLSDIGVSETGLIRECDASFKQGSKFVEWVTGDTRDYYYHPFVIPTGYHEANLAAEWRRHHASAPFADLVSFQPHLCEQGRAPKQSTTPEFAAVANYAYHFDAVKTGFFLRRHCVEHLGVEHVVDHVLGVNSAENGDIESLQTRDHGLLEGDLFVDCTGFTALLLGQHYGIPFISRKQVLFNDTALVTQVPYSHETSPIVSHTVSTARAAGWIWDIGLPTRRGIGYVYSSAHANDGEAEAVLLDYVRQLPEAAVDAMGPMRKIPISPGHRETFWHRNCVAVGMSAGFIEPLEASALALIEMSAAMLRDDLPATRDDMDIVAPRFNDRFTYRWKRVVDFLKLHYVLSKRNDSDYWRDNRRAETIPSSLQELMRLWRYRSPSRYDFFQIEEIFPAASYHYVLYGMGFEPARDAVRGDFGGDGRAAHFLRENARMTSKMLAALPTNRELIEQIGTHGLQRI